jgi:mRNA interferase RelE/StbE
VSEYTVALARSARKELQALDRTVAARVFRRIEALATTPRPSGCKKLEGAVNLWRLRVGDWRVVYSVDDSKLLVDISAVRHRRDVYR